MWSHTYSEAVICVQELVWQSYRGFRMSGGAFRFSLQCSGVIQEIWGQALGTMHDHDVEVLMVPYSTLKGPSNLIWSILLQLRPTWFVSHTVTFLVNRGTTKTSDHSQAGTVNDGWHDSICSYLITPTDTYFLELILCLLDWRQAQLLHNVF